MSASERERVWVPAAKAARDTTGRNLDIVDCGGRLGNRRAALYDPGDDACERYIELPERLVVDLEEWI